MTEISAVVDLTLSDSEQEEEQDMRKEEEQKQREEQKRQEEERQKKQREEQQGRREEERQQKQREEQKRRVILEQQRAELEHWATQREKLPHERRGLALMVALHEKHCVGEPHLQDAVQQHIRDQQRLAQMLRSAPQPAALTVPSFPPLSAPRAVVVPPTTIISVKIPAKSSRRRRNSPLPFVATLPAKRKRTSRGRLGVVPLDDALDKELEEQFEEERLEKEQFFQERTNFEKEQYTIKSPYEWRREQPQEVAKFDNDFDKRLAEEDDLRYIFAVVRQTLARPL